MSYFHLQALVENYYAAMVRANRPGEDNERGMMMMAVAWLLHATTHNKTEEKIGRERHSSNFSQNNMYHSMEGLHSRGGWRNKKEEGVF